MLLHVPSASAGLAIFDPPVTVVPLGYPEVSIDIALQNKQLPNFDSVDAIILSDVPFTFDYSRQFRAAAGGFIQDPPVVINPGDLGLMDYSAAVYAAGATLGYPFGYSFWFPILLGTVTIDTAALAPGKYEVLISSELDGGVSALWRQGLTEPLEGRGVIIIPEPGCALLLLGGAIIILRRRAS